jgi:hypothetical protein
VVITRTSTYGTGFQGDLRYGNGKIEGATNGSDSFMTGLNSSYSGQSVTSSGGFATTYAELSNAITAFYINVIGRFPESLGYDGWINDFRFGSPRYTSFQQLQANITLAYQNNGEQAYQQANGGLIGNFDNCGNRRV